MLLYEEKMRFLRSEMKFQNFLILLYINIVIKNNIYFHLLYLIFLLRK